MRFRNDCWLSANRLYGYDCSGCDGLLSVDVLGISVDSVVWSIVWSVTVLEVVGLSVSGLSFALTSLFLRLGAVLNATIGLLGSISFRYGLARTGFQCSFMTLLIQLIWSQ